MRGFLLVLATLVGTAVIIVTNSQSLVAEETAPVANIERASGERLATAVGHYARARTLLLAAVREFDKGMALANANTLMDTTRFRASLTNRAAELERVLDPQPRATKTGIKYSADTRLLGEAKN